MDLNPKSLCAIEARIEALQIRLADNEEQLNRALIAFQDFVQSQHNKMKIINMTLDNLRFGSGPKNNEENERTCPPDCQGCSCPSGRPPCNHCVEHGDPDS